MRYGSCPLKPADGANKGRALEDRIGRDVRHDPEVLGQFRACGCRGSARGRPPRVLLASRLGGRGRGHRRLALWPCAPSKKPVILWIDTTVYQRRGDVVVFEGYVLRSVSRSEDGQTYRTDRLLCLISRLCCGYCIQCGTDPSDRGCPQVPGRCDPSV